MNTKQYFEECGYEDWTMVADIQDQEYAVSKKKLKSTVKAIRKKRQEETKVAESNYDAMVANKNAYLNRGQYAEKPKSIAN